MNLFLKPIHRRLTNLFTSTSGPRPSRRPLTVEALEDRVVPAVTLPSPNGRWVATILGQPGIESLRVTENATGRLVYQSGGVKDVLDGTLTWSPNSLEVAWVQENSTNIYSYSWAGALPPPSTVPAFATPPSAPIFSADSRFLTFNLPGNPGQVTFSVPTTPPGVFITNIPATVTAGSPFQVTVTANANDFLGLPYVGTLALSASDGQPVLGMSTVTMTSNNQGKAVVPIQLNKAGTLAIRGTESNGVAGSSRAFVVNPAGISAFTVSAPSRAIVGAPFAVTLTARDAFGNGATGYSGSAALSLSSGQTVTPSVVSFSNGTARPNVTLDTTGSVSLLVRDGFFTGASGAIAVASAATTTTLGASANPSEFGQPVTFTATVKAVAPSTSTPTGNVTFVVDGGTPVTVPLTLGQARLTLPSLAVGKHTINASYFANPNYKNSTATLTQTVNLALTRTVPDATAGDNYSATLQASGGSGNYSYALVSGALPNGLSLSNSGALTGRTTVAGRYTFTVKATDHALAGVTATQTYVLTVKPAAITALGVTAPSTATAGTGFLVTITAKDAFGNPYSGTLALSSSDPKAVLPANLTLVNGRATATVVLKTAGPATFTAALGTITGNATIAVNPAAASAIAVTAPTATTAGQSFGVSLTARDAFGNPVPSFNGVVSVYPSDGQVAVARVTLTNGKAATTMTLTLARTIRVVASNGVIGGVSELLTVSPAAVARITVASATAVVAGGRLDVTITGKDAYGNNVSGSAKLTSSDSQALTPNTFTMTNGVAVASVYLTRAGVTQLTATMGAVVGTGSNVTVLPAALASFVVSAPATATAGSAFSLTVTAKDRYGNTVVGFTVNVVLTSSDGQVVSPSYVTLVKGTVTTTVTLKVRGTVKLTAAYGTLKGTSDVITVV